MPLLSQQALPNNGNTAAFSPLLKEQLEESRLEKKYEEKIDKVLTTLENEKDTQKFWDEENYENITVGEDATTDTEAMTYEEDEMTAGEDEENVSAEEDEDANDVKDDMIQVKADESDESLLLSNCGLSRETLLALEKRNIKALFPIQKHVFEPAMNGRDLIGRAKTGSGKTLAFAIPIVENLIKEDRENGHRRMSGRPPRAIVITPTRELANQVCREFQTVCPELAVRSFYGGVSVGGNRRDLESGVDVAVGTPGRIMDLHEQRALNLSKIRFAVLDESDQMLDMGFEQDMEKILAFTPREKQTMLFSATLPMWVRKVARKYLSNHLIVDLLGDEGTGTISDTIRALGLYIDNGNKRQTLTDVLTAYAAGKQSIVFTQTKREADAIHGVTNSAVRAAVLHGDISQSSREITLQRFRNRQFACLVATDVAARGLDIPSVDLVVHYDCPLTHESFVHRSGRTGRAGKTGTTLVMVERGDVHSFHKIIRDSQTAITMIGPPNPRDVMQSSTRSVLERMQKVQPDMIKFFKPAAEKLMKEADATQMLAMAMASMSGFTSAPKPRGLLTNMDGGVTVRFMGRPGRITGRGSVVGIIDSLTGQAGTAGITTRVEMVSDDDNGLVGVMIDLPSEVAMEVLEAASAHNPNIQGIVIDRPPALTLDQLIQQIPRPRSGQGNKNRGSRMGGGSRYGGNSSGYSSGYGGSRSSYGGNSSGYSSGYGGSRSSGGYSRYGGSRSGDGGAVGGYDDGSRGGYFSSDRGSYKSNTGSSYGRRSSKWSDDDDYFESRRGDKYGGSKRGGGRFDRSQSSDHKGRSSSYDTDDDGW